MRERVGGIVAALIGATVGALLWNRTFAPASGWSWTRLLVAVLLGVGLSLLVERLFDQPGRRGLHFGKWQLGGAALAVAVSVAEQLSHEALSAIGGEDVGVKLLWMTAGPVAGLITAAWLVGAMQRPSRAALAGGIAGLAAGWVSDYLVFRQFMGNMVPTWVIAQEAVPIALVWMALGAVGGLAVDRGGHPAGALPVALGTLGAMIANVILFRPQQPWFTTWLLLVGLGWLLALWVYAPRQADRSVAAVRQT